MTEKVNLTWLVKDGEFFVSAPKLLEFFEKQDCHEDGCPVYANLVHNLHNLQNHIQRIPTTDDFKIHWEKNE